MSDQNIDLLCEGCGETLSNFLQEMADKNAKIATCPKCGKIHPVSSQSVDPRNKGRQNDAQPIAKKRTALKKI